MVHQQGGVQYLQGPQIIQAGQQQIQLVPGVTSGVQEPQQIYVIQDDQPQQQQQQVVATAPGAPQQTYIIDQGGAPGAPQVQQIQLLQAAQPARKVKHIPLAKARVLYVGSAVPLETAIGLEALQQPLRERYHVGGGEVPGIDAWLTVFSSGIKIKYVSKDSNDNPSVWFPIQTLHVCAAVKAIDLILANSERQTKFVALDSENGKKSNHPPIFATIMRRTSGRKILEAHVFVCKSNAGAMALVKSATHAYEHKEGWTEEEPEEEPMGGSCDGGDPMRLLAAEPADTCKERNAPPEFYKPTPAQGYYYTPNKDLVKNYNIHGSGGPKQPAGPPALPPVPPPHAFGPGAMVPAFPDPYGYGPPPMEYFDDWGAFSGPVSIFGPPPPDMMYGPPMPQQKAKKKKKKSKKRHDCCCEEEYDDDCCCNDDRNRRDYYADDHYKSYREKNRGSRRDDHDCCDRDRDRGRDRDRDRGYKVEYTDREPRDRVIVEREREPRRDRYDDPYRSERRGGYDYGDDLLFYAPTYMDGDMFYDGYGGGGGGGYGGGYIDGGYGGGYVGGGYGGGYGGGGYGGGGYGGGYGDGYGYDALADQFGRALRY